MANILIVEDEKAMQEIIADFLHKNGHNCRCIGNPKE